jgi:phospholipase D1/2
MGDALKQKHLAAAGQPMATYPERQGNRVTLYQLGSSDRAGSKGAFKDLADAIAGAQKFIFICDWSFQPYVRLGPRTSGAKITETAGAMLNERAKSGVLVAIHVWDHTNIAAADDWNDNGAKWLDEIAKQVSGGKEKARSPNLLYRLSSRTGVGYSFHQKYVILDADDSVTGKRVVKAFFGGLDITKGRFDWGEHPCNDNASVEPFAAVNNGSRGINDWYNAEFTTHGEPGDVTMPRQAWQDYYANIIGPAAWDLAREFVGRWNSDNKSFLSGPSGDKSPQDKERVENLFRSLFTDAGFTKEWEPHQGSFVARVVRSIEKVDWTQRIVEHVLAKNEIKNCDTATKDGKTQTEFIWRLNGNFEKSIEESYVNAIQNANRFIYIETQYFIGSGSDWGHTAVKNRIPRAIVDKICDKIDAEQEFHAYIIIPMFPEGDPVSSAARDQRQYEWSTMEFMAKTVAAKAIAKGKDWEDFLSFYFLANNTAGGTPVTMAGGRKARVKANKRYMVYVHSKLMIIDDQFLILGSANLNERSLAGDRDAEICVYLRPAEGKLKECQAIISALRKQAWKDHLGKLPPNVDNPETKTCSSDLRTKGLANWIALSMNAALPDGSHIVKFPFAADANAFYIKTQTTDSGSRYQEMFIFDAEAVALSPPLTGTTIKNDWMWWSPVSGNTPAYLAE